jgi:hypothetical protein
MQQETFIRMSPGTVQLRGVYCFSEISPVQLFVMPINIVPLPGK